MPDKIDYYLKSIQEEFSAYKNPSIADNQKQYMRGKFEYFGIKTPLRREIQKKFLTQSNLPDYNNLDKVIHKLWELPQRDFQLFGIDLIKKYSRQFQLKDIVLLEHITLHKSWWDTVDFIASHHMGSYFKKFPDQQIPTTTKWIQSNNIWLQRSALLYQLKYKSQLNTAILSNHIVQLFGSQEFFINKAIGWVLREYGKTNPDWVLVFVSAHPNLHNLSKKEALRIILKK